MAVTGNVYPETERDLPAYPYRTPPVVFRNLGAGKLEQLFLFEQGYPARGAAEVLPQILTEGTVLEALAAAEQLDAAETLGWALLEERVGQLPPERKPAADRRPAGQRRRRVRALVGAL